MAERKTIMKNAVMKSRTGRLNLPYVDDFPLVGKSFSPETTRAHPEDPCETVSHSLRDTPCHSSLDRKMASARSLTGTTEVQRDARVLVRLDWPGRFFRTRVVAWTERSSR